MHFLMLVMEIQDFLYFSGDAVSGPRFPNPVRVIVICVVITGVGGNSEGTAKVEVHQKQKQALDRYFKIQSKCG